MLSAETFRKIYANIFNKIANDKEKKRNKGTKKKLPWREEEREGKKLNSPDINAQKSKRRMKKERKKNCQAVDYNVHPAEAMSIT